MIKSGYSRKYINNTIFALTHFFEMHDKPIKISRLKPENRIPSYLTEEEVKELLGSIKNVKQKAIVSLLFYGGLRTLELRNITIDDIDLDKRMVRIRDPKNGFDDYIIISEKCVIDLKDWIELRNRNYSFLIYGNNGQRITYKPVYNAVVKNAKKHYSFLIYGNNGQRITYKPVYTAVVKNAKKLWNKRVYPHMLRHSLATILIGRGCDVSFVQKQLRHKDISTTMIYVHLNKEMLKKAYDRYVPEF